MPLFQPPIQLVVTSKKQETAQAVTVFFEPRDERPLAYLSGQFLTFIFTQHETEFRRSYSLSSAPFENRLSITVKRVENGLFSRYFVDECKPGDILDVLPPAGLFNLAEYAKKERDIFLLGAGSGISPLYSLLKTALAEWIVPVHLIYSNRSTGDTIFYDELRDLQLKHADRLSIDWLFSTSRNLQTARLNSDLMLALVKQNLRYKKKEALFFICGPTDYMDMIEITLLTYGFSKDHIRREQFVIEEPETNPVLYQNNEPHTVLIHGDGTTYSIEVPERTTILRAALDNGIALPYSCMAGRCSSCSAQCIRGEVKMSYNEVLTDRDLAAGRILTCTGYPASDVELLFR